MSASTTQRPKDFTQLRWAGLRSIRILSRQVPLAVELYRLGTNPRWTLEVWADLISFLSSARYARQIPPLDPKAQTVLLVMFRDDVFDVKLMASLAIGLRLRGVRPVLLLPNRRMTRSWGLFRAMGLGRPRFREEFEDESSSTAAGISSLKAAISNGIEGVRNWEYDGYPAGLLLLSTLIREMEDPTPNLNVAYTRRRALQLGFVAMRGYRCGASLLDQLRPNHVVVQEPGYVTNGPLVDQALRRGVGVVHVTTCWRDDALLVKRLTPSERRALPASVSPVTFRRLSLLPWTQADDSSLAREFEARYGGKWEKQREFQPQTGRQSKTEIVESLGLNPRRPTAVIFCHVLWDATFWAGKDIYANYGEWLLATVGCAAANANLNWIVKTHPNNIFRHEHGDTRHRCAEMRLLNDRFGKLPDHLHVLTPDTPLTSLSLYEHCDYGLTVRGMAGFEMACFGKVVVTAGTGTYAGLGFTEDPNTPEEYELLLSRLHTVAAPPPEKTALAKRYALTLFADRPWRMKSIRPEFRYAKGGRHPLDRNFKVIAGSLEEVRALGDLTDMADWLAFSESPDYMSSWRTNVLNPEAP